MCSSDLVEENWQKDKGPLDQGEEGDAMDRENRVLEDIRPAVQAGIGNKVDAHVGADRNQATQGVESADQEVMLLEEILGGARGGHIGGGRFSHSRRGFTADFAQKSSFTETVEDT